MEKKCYVTVDFEDFSHDFKRRVLCEKDPKINKEALSKSYEYIKYLLSKLNDIKITFYERLPPALKALCNNVFNYITICFSFLTKCEISLPH